MNFSNYTIKSQETVQQAQQLAQELDHNQIENEHIFKAISLVDKNVLPFLLKIKHQLQGCSTNFRQAARKFIKGEWCSINAFSRRC